MQNNFLKKTQQITTNKQKKSLYIFKIIKLNLNNITNITTNYQLQYKP